MARMFVIWKKELRSYFNSPIAYIFIVAFLIFTGMQFFQFSSRGEQGEFRGNFFIQGEASLTDYFRVFPLMLSILVPILCMRLWPEERKSWTIDVLMTLPLRAWEVVCGKFLAMLSILAMTLLFSLSVPWTVSGLSVEGLDWGPIWGAYGAAFLMGAAYASIGLVMSAFAREQVVALLAALFVCFPLALIGTSDIDLLTPNWLSPIGQFVGFSVRFASIAKGVFEFRDIMYFATFTALFVFLNISIVEYRRVK